jgi:hypothetical protein
MHLLRTYLAGTAVGLAIILGACSQQASGPSPQEVQAQADAAKAAKNHNTYRELLRINKDAMAVTMGKSIVEQFPDSAAAAEVQKTLPEIEKRYRENSEKNRLAALWQYQVAPMAGGTQSTATILNSKPVTGERVKLVLRRHTKWGENVFLFGSGKGFVCGKSCTLKVTVDGKLHRVKAFAPPTGEPALMMNDDKGFLKLLSGAQKVEIEVTPAASKQQETLVYEVGGFDPSRWSQLDKRKK